MGARTDVHTSIEAIGGSSHSGFANALMPFGSIKPGMLKARAGEVNEQLDCGDDLCGDWIRCGRADRAI